MTSIDTDVVVIGAGIAGLTCVRFLHQNHINFLLFEADERIGGRIKTDRKDGFILDHGFQILQTAYPAALEELDYSNLGLCSFAPGTVIRVKDKFHTVADPLRRPADLLKTLAAPIGTLGDRLRLLRLAKQVIDTKLEDLFGEPELETINYLQQRGFSELMINRFFSPFFGGACLDRNIRTSNHVFLYILKMFASGDAALPELGMDQIPKQLARHLPEESVLTGSKVIAVEPGRVQLESGRIITAKAVVVATEGSEAKMLLGRSQRENNSVGETCFYFSSDRASWHSSYLVLNGNEEGPINNLAFPSMVSPSYAPPGKSLISVVALDNSNAHVDDLFQAVQSQLKNWYGNEVNNWSHIATYGIPHALPEQLPPTGDPTKVEPMVGDGIFICGEYGSLPAIQWALFSGKKAARAVVEYLREG